MTLGLESVSAGRMPSPLFHAFQLEGACAQQRLLERQELLVFFDTNCASALPMPVPLPPIVLVGAGLPLHRGCQSAGVSDH